MKPSSDVAFTPSVKALQARHGSRAAYAKLEARGGFPQDLDEDALSFIAQQRSCFLATASAEGQPYIQHRGGPPGFLHAVDRRTLAFADFRGNKQFISVGNLAENAKVHLFLIDYATRSRVKIWGTAKVVEHPAEIAALGLDATNAERALVIHIDAWDENCPQHIPLRVDAEDVARVLAERDARIAELERRLAERG
ncbi:MAG: pyridoxamine 5'-phosphate oxidase family protein [Deltaproteobacteria bacterium]|nr:pyridoxamine 5'-phosphate oxidase family protein [Deltaproteobacteria bacterium]